MNHWVVPQTVDRSVRPGDDLPRRGIAMTTPHSAVQGGNTDSCTETKRAFMRTLHELQALRNTQSCIRHALCTLQAAAGPDAVTIARKQRELRSNQADIAAHEDQLKGLREDLMSAQRH